MFNYQRVHNTALVCPKLGDTPTYYTISMGQNGESRLGYPTFPKNNVHCPKNIPSLKPDIQSHIPGIQITIHFVVGLSLQLFILLLLLVCICMIGYIWPFLKMMDPKSQWVSILSHGQICMIWRYPHDSANLHDYVS